MFKWVDRLNIKLSNYFQKLADENKKEFGSEGMSCCDLNKDKKEN